ncbi:TetR/AcrR family transcriptional regulator [Aquisalimonas sp.]|uniref:TetR/AcrR family transcriptional regulator n=1 Tax=Aquisalimonas sp. TaxID=1872621 RepID=UPI0025BC9E34|nr:TetR/AcrR family transcriptional regulator [Aquisalimonas sp.]
MTTTRGTEGYPAFRRKISNHQDEFLREVFERHHAVIRIKKEAVVLRKLQIIFDTTLELSNQHGFQATSVRDLSVATGISMGSLYSYIESKDRLLSMIQSYGQVVVNRTLRIPEHLTVPLERLRHLLRTHVYITEILQPWFYFSYMESRHFDPDARERAIAGELRTERLISELLQEGISQGAYRVENPELTAALIKPLLQEWYLKRWKYRRRRITVDDYADGMIAFVESAVGGR